MGEAAAASRGTKDQRDSQAPRGHVQAEGGRLQGKSGLPFYLIASLCLVL